MPNVAKDVWLHFHPLYFGQQGRVRTVRRRYCSWGREGGVAANATRCELHARRKHPGVRIDGDVPDVASESHPAAVQL